MRVTILSPELPVPPVRGGAIETGIYATAAHFKDSEITVVSLNQNLQQNKTIHEGTIKYVQLALEDWKGQLQKSLNRFGLRVFSWYDVYSIQAIVRYLMSVPRPDVIEIRNNFYWVPFIRRNFPQSRIILKMHNDFLFAYPKLLQNYRSLLHQTDHILVISDFLRRKIIKHCPELDDRITVVHEGVDQELFRPLDSQSADLAALRKQLSLTFQDKVFIYVGRITENKGVHLLIDAFKQVAAQRDNVKLLVVGSSWFEGSGSTPYIRKIAAASKVLGSKIRFTGYVPHDELNNYYNLADICVVPSILQEAFGLINLEAMACGCAVIASKVGGIPEIIDDGETGVLVEPDDAVALAQAMMDLVSDAHFRDYLRKNASLRVKNHFQWSRVAQESECIYSELVSSVEKVAH